jgi:deoxyadenosine/deoxycytidine kinase
MSSQLARFRHIAIEGPIGAGKTSLARKLAARLGAELMLERPAENPFLDRFYADMPGYAFQTQLFFLFQRQKQVQAIAQPNVFGAAVVSDFMLAKDALFARLTLSDEEHRLYALMYAQVASQVREPDLVIWLQASPDTLLARVRRRGIAMEHAIDTGYLARLCDAYAEHFHAYEGAPVFAVDTENVNFVDRDVDVAHLLDRLDRFEGRRDTLGSTSSLQ